MTNEQLNRLAATEVMKWAVHCRNTAHYVKASEQFTTYNSPQHLVSEFRPTTNEAHAAMVREKMRADGWLWDIEIGEDVFACCYRIQEDIKPYARGKELPSAIVRAALMAVDAITEEELNG